ncbi:MAG TPA: hypothetical protein VK599_00050 [Streptosporangiaceae bacterium]|nr:hypothetical protein [Streptosporangiaceae bacterium]
MRAIANTRATILTGTTTDEFGDVIDSATPGADPRQRGFPASITQSSKTITTPEQPTPRVIRTHIAQLPADTPVGPEDRLRDDVTGTVYAITAVTAERGIGHAPDVRLDLKQVT